MEHTHTNENEVVVEEKKEIVAARAKPGITIPLDRQSALVGFCALLLIALAFETYQLVTLRQVILGAAPASAAANAPAVPATPSGLDALPTMSGGC